MTRNLITTVIYSTIKRITRLAEDADIWPSLSYVMRQSTRNIVECVCRIRFAVGPSNKPAQPLVKLHWVYNERMNWPFS